MSDDDEIDGLSEESSDAEEEEDRSNAVPSKAIKDKLAEDDAEIAALEKNLGIKSRKTLPKSFHEDGLDEILGQLAEQEDDEALLARRKRKTEDDEWLAQKRRKATNQPTDDEDDDEDDEADEDDEDDALDSEHEEEEAPVRKRENPYVAPVPVPAAAAAQKYVPPARRREAGSDAEQVSRIRRQAQGFINRLTDSNLIAILGDIEKLYRDHPRQHVTSALVDLVLAQICEPTSLPDTLLILHAGFATAVYKVIGSDVGAQLIQQAAERFRGFYAQVANDAPQGASKETSNLITFLAQTYNFRFIGCKLIFDYVRLLLDHLSELNAELLLRIVRMAGQNLRKDDPLALKDIVGLIRVTVEKVGKEKLSVRTKMMIEAINDLKNNKVRAGKAASTVVRDHTMRMNKILGSLNSRRLRATEPLRIGLKDMEESDRRGKWWLVGASWAGRGSSPGKQAGEEEADGGTEEEEAKDTRISLLESEESEDPVPDLDELARELNMNTDLQRAIFTAIMSAHDYKDACRRLRELPLKKNWKKEEIGHVLFRCAFAEHHEYNPYYSWVALEMCADKKIKFALKESLWNMFRGFGELVFNQVEEVESGDEDDEEGEATDVRRIVCVGQMFGFLIANGAQELMVLRCLNLRHLRPKGRDFVLVLLITLFQELKKAGRKPTRVFSAVTDMALSQGLQWFLRKRVRKSDLVEGKKDKKLVKKGCDEAITILSTKAEG